MIFFAEQIDTFYEEGNPHPINPISVTLKDNRVGYFLGDDKRNAIEAKGISVNIISHDDMEIDEQ